MCCSPRIPVEREKRTFELVVFLIDNYAGASAHRDLPLACARALKIAESLARVSVTERLVSLEHVHAALLDIVTPPPSSSVSQPVAQNAWRMIVALHVSQGLL
jgi:hypothetical protein